MNEPHRTINISTVTLLKIVVICLMLVFLWLVRDVLLILIISVIIASAIDPVADFLQKRKIPRGLSVLVVFILFLGLLSLFGFLMAPSITQQFNDLKNADIYNTFTSKVGVYRETLSHSAVGRAIDSSFKDVVNNFSSNLFATTKGVLTAMISTMTILVISFYLTAEENGMKNFIRHLAPYKHQAYIARLVNKIQLKMGAWVLGQFILSAVIFGLVYIGLTVLKVKYALILALIAAVMEIIPIIGPFISGAVAAFFAFLQSPGLAAAVVIMWVIAQQLESNVIVPIVMSRSVGLNPVIVILGVLVGGTLGGVVGALIAIPVMGGISVFVADVMEQNESPE